MPAVAGVTVRVARDQPNTLLSVCPALAVKLRPLPSRRVVPTVIPLTTSEAGELLSPAGPLTVALIVPSAIGEPSPPVSVDGDQLAVGASGFTVTASVACVALILPSASRTVAVTVN